MKISSLKNQDIGIIDKVSYRYRIALEQLFFHNPRQHFHINAVKRMVEKYGNPKIIEKDGYLEMTSENCSDSHSLFISQGPVLIGILIYHQNCPSNIEFIHIAINDEYINGDLSDLLLKCVGYLKLENIKTYTIGYLERETREKKHFLVK